MLKINNKPVPTEFTPSIAPHPYLTGKEEYLCCSFVGTKFHGEALRYKPHQTTVGSQNCKHRCEHYPCAVVKRRT